MKTSPERPYCGVIVHRSDTSPSTLVPIRSALEDEPEDEAITILLVERDTATGDALARRLRGRGYSVELLSSGAEASAKLDEDGHDVVVVGWELADASGLELLRRVRMRHAAADLPRAGGDAADIARSLVVSG